MAASEEIVSDETRETFHKILVSFAEITTKDGKNITDKGIGKMSKQCCPKLSNGLDIAFSGVATNKKLPLMTDWETKFLARCGAEQYKFKKSATPQTDFVNCLKLAEATGTTKTSKTGGVAKMTDTKLYTGSHKDRFNKEGKGKGIAGREEIADTSGYVGGYKGEGTYDKKK